MASQQTTGTAIPAGDLRLVTAAFALGSVSQVRFLPEGLISGNWQITADRGVFALKQIKDAPPPQARRNLRAAAALHAAGIPALEPVLTVTGDTIAEAGERHYCLSWWIEGHHLPGTRLSSGQTRHAGAVLARVHQGLSRAGPEAGLPGTAGSVTAVVPDPEIAAATADRFLARITGLREPQPWDLVIARSLRRRKELLSKHAADRPASSSPRGPSGWTHGDFHPLNLIWNHSGITGITDWNRLAVRTYADEVTRSAILMFSSDDGRIDLQRTAEFAAGYQQTIPLDPGDLADAVHRRWWKLLCDYRYLDGHYTRGDRSCDRLAEPESRLLEWWTSHQQEVMTAFTAQPQQRSAAAK